MAGVVAAALGPNGRFIVPVLGNCCPPIAGVLPSGAPKARPGMGWIGVAAPTLMPYMLVPFGDEPPDAPACPHCGCGPTPGTADEGLPGKLMPNERAGFCAAGSGGDHPDVVGNGGGPASPACCCRHTAACCCNWAPIESQAD